MIYNFSMYYQISVVLYIMYVSSYLNPTYTVMHV